MEDNLSNRTGRSPGCPIGCGGLNQMELHRHLRIAHHLMLCWLPYFFAGRPGGVWGAAAVLIAAVTVVLAVTALSLLPKSTPLPPPLSPQLSTPQPPPPLSSQLPLQLLLADCFFLPLLPRGLESPTTGPTGKKRDVCPNTSCQATLLFRCLHGF